MPNDIALSSNNKPSHPLVFIGDQLLLIGEDEHEMAAFTPDQERATTASRGKIGIVCCRQGAPQLCLVKAGAKTARVPIPLTSLAGRKNIKVLASFIIPPATQQHPLAMLCYLHLLACL